ncbi:hypothetical protein PHLCEN_2v2179, partial [Hermanssonia centrifuga]
IRGDRIDIPDIPHVERNPDEDEPEGNDKNVDKDTESIGQIDSESMRTITGTGLFAYSSQPSG